MPVFKFLQTRWTSTKRAPQTRSLRLERLESRAVLSGDSPFYFATDFESYTPEQWADRPHSGGLWNLSGIDPYFADVGEGDSISLADGQLASSGTKAVKVVYDRNEDRGQAITYIDPGLDEIHVRQKMLFRGGYDVGAGEKILRLFSYDGTEDRVNIDLIAVLWAKPQSGHAAGDLTGINDSYGITFGTNGARWGTAYEHVDGTDFVLQRDRWYTIQVDVKLNKAGQSDGALSMRIDGQVVAELNGIQLRQSETHKFNRVLLGGWYSNGGGGNPSPEPAGINVRYIDDYVISERPFEASESASVAFQAVLVNAKEQPVEQVSVGEDFWLDVYAEDLRTNATGVFAAALDVIWDSTHAVATAPVQYGNAYPNYQHVEASGPGSLDDIGAIASTNPLAKRNLLFRMPMRAVAKGELGLDMNPADRLPEHATLLLGDNRQVPANQLVFQVPKLQIVDLTLHHATRFWDVNNDGILAPVDVLIIINYLNTSPRSPAIGAVPPVWSVFFLDVNNDAQVTPVDALQVINALNASLTAFRLDVM